jgi:hypothetical protein
LTVALIVGFRPGWLGIMPRGTATNLSVSPQLIAVPIANRDGSAARSASEVDWVDVGPNALLKSDLRLVVTSVTIKPLEYTDAKDRKFVTKERHLQIGLRLSNVGINHTIEYFSWGESRPVTGDRAPRLQDNLGTTYRIKVLEAGTQVAGHVAHATIGPMKAVHDVLVFEAPMGGIEFLRLELPCSAFGAQDKFRLKIPKRLLVYQ